MNIVTTPRDWIEKNARCSYLYDVLTVLTKALVQHHIWLLGACRLRQAQPNQSDELYVQML